MPQQPLQLQIVADQQDGAVDIQLLDVLRVVKPLPKEGGGVPIQTVGGGFLKSFLSGGFPRSLLYSGSPLLGLGASRMPQALGPLAPASVVNCTTDPFLMSASISFANQGQASKCLVLHIRLDMLGGCSGGKASC